MGKKIHWITIFTLLLSMTTFQPSQALDFPALIQNLRVDTTSINAGETITVSFQAIGTPSFTADLASKNSVSLWRTSEDECELDCPVGVASLVSGTIGNGNWESKIRIPANSYSGEYTLDIFFTGFKGYNGFFIRYSSKIVINGVPVPPPAPRPTISITSLSLNKSSAVIGDKVLVSFAMSSTNFPSVEAEKNSVYLVSDTSSDCDEECAGAIAVLKSGTVSSGTWEAEITIPSRIYTGKYKAQVFFASAKGVNGSFVTSSQTISVTGTPPPAPIVFPTLTYSNIAADKYALKGGESLRISWNLVTQNFTKEYADSLAVNLYPKDESDCTSSCPRGQARLVSGTLENGRWEAQVEVPSDSRQTDYEIFLITEKAKYPGWITKASFPIRISDVTSSFETILPVLQVSGTGHVPSIGPITRTRDGFFAQILNFDWNYRWTYNSTVGTAGIDGTGLFKVTGIPAGTESQITIQTSTLGGTLTTAKFSASSLTGNPLVPTVSATTSLKDGYEFTISNFNTFWRYTIVPMAGNVVSSGNGKYRLMNIPESTTVVIGIYTDRVGYAQGFKAVSGSSLPILNQIMKPAPVPTSSPTVTPTPTPSPSPLITPTPSPVASSLPTVSPSPSPSPVKKKKITITCVKGKTTKKVTGTKPICPKGYQKK